MPNKKMCASCSDFTERAMKGTNLTIEEMTKMADGFILFKKQIKSLDLSEEQQSCLKTLKIPKKLKKSNEENLSFYLRLFIPVKRNPIELLKYLESEYSKCDKVKKSLKSKGSWNKFIDGIVYKFFGERALNLVITEHNTYNAFLNYQYCKLYCKGFKKDELKLSFFKKHLYNSMVRKVVKKRATFFRKNLEAVGFFLYPPYPEHEPPATPSEWIQRINQIREEYKNEVVDF